MLNQYWTGKEIFPHFGTLLPILMKSKWIWRMCNSVKGFYKWKQTAWKNEWLKNKACWESINLRVSGSRGEGGCLKVQNHADSEHEIVTYAYFAKYVFLIVNGRQYFSKGKFNTGKLNFKWFAIMYCIIKLTSY